MMALKIHLELGAPQVAINLAGLAGLRATIAHETFIQVATEVFGPNHGEVVVRALDARAPS
ncbi:hypothetical protein [Dactylosporangium sp. CA-139066]|uniref:hypothetical protein n=1 Tax=Dactylosporangium sp. CA-139066 TaxID=3239930 RepID=UPI003D91431E